MASKNDLIMDDNEEFSSSRVFMNNVDSYHSEFMVKCLGNIRKPSKSVQGSKVSIPGEGYGTPNVNMESMEVIGTCNDSNLKKLDGVSKFIPKQDCIGPMVNCAYVIIDITLDETALDMVMDYIQAISLIMDGPEAGDSKDVDRNHRYLIVISTCLTWALTKPLDPDSPDMPFVDTDFRKRRPHPNFKKHCNVENEVMQFARKFKGRLNALVLNMGVTYGGVEDIFWYWFQKAWECEPVLPVLGKGNNIIPLLNIRDLASIICQILEEFPEKLYILAVEQNTSTQKEIIQALSRSFGTGVMQNIPKEDGFLIKEFNQRLYDYINVNIPMEPNYIMENMSIEWVSEATFADNVSKLMKEFKKCQGLKQFKIYLHGPPGVGKTTLAKKLCDMYGLLYVSPETIYKDTVDDLTWRINFYENEERKRAEALAASEEGREEAANDDDDDGGDEAENLDDMRLTLEKLLLNSQLSDEETNGYIRTRIASKEAQNKGWILDGYPTTIAQCQALFGKGEEEGEDEEEERSNADGEEPGTYEEDMNLYENVSKKLLPVLAITLECSDDYIYKKIMGQPEMEINNTKFEEEILVKRLLEFRGNNTAEITVLNFFDELDIHPIVINVECDDYNMTKTYRTVSLRMGQPCKYGTLVEKIEAQEKAEKVERDTLEAREAKARAELEERLLHERQDEMEYWAELYSLLKEEEEKALAAQSEPLRNYLMKYIFPTLTKGLLEVAKLRPDDPLDFLAEYLFRENTTGKMFEPGFNLNAEYLLGKIEILEEALLKLNIEMPLYSDFSEDG